MIQAPCVPVASGAVAAIVSSRCEYIDSGIVSPSERLDWWQKNVNGSNGLELVCATSNFVGRMRRRAMGACTIYSLSVETPHRTIRAAAQPDLCYVNIQLGKNPVRYRGEREFSLSSGQMAVYQSVRGYQLDFTGNTDSIILAIPKQLLDAHVPALDQHFARTHPYDRGLVGLLAHACDEILNRQTHTRQAVSDCLMNSLLGLVGAILQDSVDVQAERPTWSQRATLHRVKAHVLDNLRNPDLDPAGIADAMGITVSYLHKIFRHDKSTVMQFAMSERLERCRLDIAKCDVTGNISQIAFTWGFNDASHFTRSFRRRFGQSPRQYRQSVMEQEQLFLRP